MHPIYVLLTLLVILSLSLIAYRFFRAPLCDIFQYLNWTRLKLLEDLRSIPRRFELGLVIEDERKNRNVSFSRRKGRRRRRRRRGNTGTDTDEEESPDTSGRQQRKEEGGGGGGRGGSGGGGGGTLAQQQQEEEEEDRQEDTTSSSSSPTVTAPGGKKSVSIQVCPADFELVDPTCGRIPGSLRRDVWKPWWFPPSDSRDRELRIFCGIDRDTSASQSENEVEGGDRREEEEEEEEGEEKKKLQRGTGRKRVRLSEQPSESPSPGDVEDLDGFPLGIGLSDSNFAWRQSLSNQEEQGSQTPTHTRWSLGKSHRRSGPVVTGNQILEMILHDGTKTQTAAISERTIADQKGETWKNAQIILDPSVASSDLDLEFVVAIPLQEHFDKKTGGIDAVQKSEQDEELLGDLSTRRTVGTTQIVDLSARSLARLPLGLMELKNVSQLSIASNFVARLPKWLMLGDSIRTTLTHLDLSANFLYEIPEGLSLCSNLKELNLSDNRLQWLPVEFALGLVGLTHLDVSENRLLCLPAIIGHLHRLSHLDVSHNWLVELPPNLFRSPRLRLFVCDGNLLGQATKSLVKRRFGRSALATTRSHSVGRHRRTASVSSESWDATSTMKFAPLLSRVSSSLSLSSHASQDGPSFLPRESLEELEFELFAMELTYTRLLNVFHKIYYVPLVVNYETTIRISRISDLETQDLAVVIPSVLPRILAFHRTLFAIVKAAPNGRRGIALSDFLRRNSQALTSMYVKYCKLAEISSMMLKRCRRASPSFNAFLKVKRRIPLARGFSFEDFVVLPIHKLSLYCSFLRRFVRVCPAQFDPVAKSALKVLENVHGEELVNRGELDDKHQIEELSATLKMPNLWKEGCVLRHHGNLLLAATQVVVDLKKSAIRGVGDVFSGNFSLKDRLEAMKTAVGKYIGQKKSTMGAIKGLVQARVAECPVTVYLLSDRLIIEYRKLLDRMRSRMIYRLETVDRVVQTGRSFVITYTEESEQEASTLIARTDDISRTWVSWINRCVRSLRRQKIPDIELEPTRETSQEQETDASVDAPSEVSPVDADEPDVEEEEGEVEDGEVELEIDDDDEEEEEEEDGSDDIWEEEWEEVTEEEVEEEEEEEEDS